MENVEQKNITMDELSALFRNHKTVYHIVGHAMQMEDSIRQAEHDLKNAKEQYGLILNEVRELIAKEQGQ